MIEKALAAGIGVAAIAYTVFKPRPTAEILAAVGAGQAGVYRAMLGPERCGKSFRYPAKSRTDWIDVLCPLVGEHTHHTDANYIIQVTDEDILWLESQYRLFREE